MTIRGTERDRVLAALASYETEQEPGSEEVELVAPDAVSQERYRITESAAETTVKTACSVNGV